MARTKVSSIPKPAFDLFKQILFDQLSIPVDSVDSMRRWLPQLMWKLAHEWLYEYDERLGREPPPIPVFPIEHAPVVKKGKVSKRSSTLPIFIATVPPSLPDGPDSLSSPSTLGPADLEVLRLAMLKGESKKQVDNSQAESSTSNVQTVVETRRKSTRGITAESTVAADAPFETTGRPNLTAPRGKRGRGLVKSGPTTSTRRKPIAKKPEAIEPVSSVEDSQLSSPLSDVISNDEFVPVSDRAQSRSLRRIAPSQPSISVPSSSSGLTLRSKRQLGSDEPTKRNDSIEAKTSPHIKRHKIDGSREQSAQSEGATPASPLGSNPEDNPRLASQSN